MGGIAVIPETIFDGSWIADASERARYLAAFKGEQDRLNGVESSMRTTGLVISEAEPVLFCAKLFAGLAYDFPVWLKASSLLPGDERRFAEILDQGAARPSALYVATGGTSGSLRFACHTWPGLLAAVCNLQGRVGDNPLRSWCCLPLRHVGGLMQVFRAILSEGNVVFGEYRDLLKRDFPRNLIEDRFVSLVPTQLARLLASPSAVAHLRSAVAVFVGGGPLDSSIALAARQAKLPVAPTYGTTETAGMVTLLSPEHFLSGRDGAGSALPGNDLDFDEGVLRIRSSSLCLGYHDRDFENGSWFQTADVGFWDEDGSLRIEGRMDRLINTGGVKVDPAKIERVILDTGMVEKCFVTGVPDSEWGRRLVAFCEPASTNPEDINHALRNQLSGASLPKLLVAVDRLPLDEMGKPDSRAISIALDGAC